MALKYKDMTQGKQEAMDLAESSRETEWKHPSFAAELFLGRFRRDLIDPFPEQDSEDKRIGDEYLNRLQKFLTTQYDAEKIDRAEKMDPEALQGLIDLGAFGMKIGKEYGGLGLSQINYMRALSLVSSHCSTATAWLSAHQSIGVPQPLKLFGTDAQKKKYLPQLTKKVSAFALTEPGVGSDPATMTTTATPTEDGKHYIINGKKLWCTNGAVADILVVMCRTPSTKVDGKERKQITAFIVEKDTPGFKVVHRCKFMGLNGIENALLEFNNVKVPVENIIWGPGQGLKLALITLNAGRLSLPGASVGGSKQMLHYVKKWAGERVQWGVPIGKHEEVAHKIAMMASHTYAMDAMTQWAGLLVDRGGADIRVEAAMSKLFGTEWAWTIIHQTLQVRGGRGFERAESLKARGEEPMPIERFMRDNRINTILEGSTEIMHLFAAREALDAHMRLSKDLLDPKASFGKKLKALVRAGLFYAAWYPRQWLYWGRWPLYSSAGPMAKHFRYISRTSHKLARQIFHMMMVHQLGLERRELKLARIVEIGTDLFAMSAACAKASSTLRKDAKRGADETALADEFCDWARERIKQNFKGIWCNHDRKSHRLAQDVLKGRFDWYIDDGITNKR